MDKHTVVTGPRERGPSLMTPATTSEPNGCFVFFFLVASPTSDYLALREHFPSVNH